MRMNGEGPDKKLGNIAAQKMQCAVETRKNFRCVNLPDRHHPQIVLKRHVADLPVELFDVRLHLLHQQ